MVLEEIIQIYDIIPFFKNYTLPVPEWKNFSSNSQIILEIENIRQKKVICFNNAWGMW